MPDEILEIRAVVRGRVQGVGFRFYAERCAEQLSLHGWVRNLYNEDVEILAQGTKAQLVDYIAKLWQGPRSAHVEDVEVHWQNPTQKYDYFSITY